MRGAKAAYGTAEVMHGDLNQNKYAQEQKDRFGRVRAGELSREAPVRQHRKGSCDKKYHHCG
jgi:hypothetical protein